jgi:hypothetical protein
MIFMPDYMESHISALGLPRVLKDLRQVVESIAENCTDPDVAAKYWWLEQDLSCAINDFAEGDNNED